MKGKAASENGWTLGEALLKFKAAVTEPSATAEAQGSIRVHTVCVSEGVKEIEIKVYLSGRRYTPLVVSSVHTDIGSV